MTYNNTALPAQPDTPPATLDTLERQEDPFTPPVPPELDLADRRSPHRRHNDQVQDPPRNPNPQMAERCDRRQ